MKKIIFLVFFIISNANFSQEVNETTKKLLQEQTFKKANDALEHGDISVALMFFHFVNSSNTDEEIKEISKKKIDSLVPIYRFKEIEKWKGRWELKQLKTDRFSYEIIEVTKNKILFYDKINSIIPSREEDIKFFEHLPKEILPNFLSLEFKNKEIWEFNFSDKKSENRLLVNMTKDVHGTSYLILDHSYNTDSNEMEKSIDENKTYYLRKK